MYKREGWAGLVSTSKVHYFRKNQSLCGKWKYFGDSFWSINLCEPSEICQKCVKLLEDKKNASSDIG